MSEQDFDNPFSFLPLATVSESGKLPPSRVKSAADLRKAFGTLRNLDEPRAFNRALVNKQLDGHPPWPQSELDEANIDQPNVNFGDARRQLKLKLTPYYDRLRSVDDLISVATTFGETEQQYEWNQVMSNEISQTFRDWPQFRFQTMKICHHCVWDGLGIGHFDGWVDWRWRFSKLGDFYFPSQTYICEDEIEFTAGRWRRPPTKLYRTIADRDVAKQMGWNPDAVIRAIRMATSHVDTTNWEYLEDQLKNNDLTLSMEANDVRCIVGFWAEFDGGVSCGIITEDPLANNEDEFLYLVRMPEKSMQDIMILFPYDTGTNAKTHGARGLGWNLFARIHEVNKSGSNWLGSHERAACLMLRARDESLMNELPLVGMGNMQLLNPNMEKIENQPMPNESALGPIQFLKSTISEETGSYAPGSRFSGSQRATKQEDEYRFGQASMLSSIDEDFWDDPLGRLFRQAVKRMHRRGYAAEEPGGREVAELRKRIEKRGVPLEAFYQIDDKRTVLNKSLGGGNAAERKEMLEQLQSIAPKFDATGQANLTRMQTVFITKSPELADQFIARDGKQRTPPDADIAILENFELMRGNDVPVRDGQINSTHAEIHVAKLEEVWTAYMQGAMTIEQYAMQGRALHDHAAIHVERMSGDETVAEMAGLYRQKLQQLGEDIANGLKAIGAAQRQAQEQGGDQQQQQQGPSAQQEQDFYEHRARMSRMADEWELRKQIKVQDAALGRALKDAEMAAKIAREERAAAARNRL